MSVDLLPRALREAPCIQTSPECRAVLGDKQCRIDMRSRQKRVRIVSSSASACIIDEDDAQRFAMGRLRWISGQNCGIEHVIITATGSELRLQDATGLTIRAGDQAIRTEVATGVVRPVRSGSPTSRIFAGSPTFLDQRFYSDILVPEPHQRAQN